MPTPEPPPDPSTDPLTPLRDSIAEVDRALLELLRRRMELAAEVGRVKTGSAATPIVVRDIEERVLTRARRYAQACGVSEGIMAEVFEAIIRASVERQHRVGIALREQRGGRVLLIGGAGGMGTWFRGFLELAGHTVDVVDPAFAGLPAQPGRAASLADMADLDGYLAILVSVPLGRMAEVLAQVVDRAPRGLVVEIASIKEPLRSPLARADAASVRVLSLHPMFGPGKSPYEPLTFVLATRRAEEVERGELEPLLSHPYAKLVAVPFPHHDRLMGWLLGLSHLTSMLFGVALSGSGIDPQELRDCASTSFLRQAATARSVLGEDPDLYLDIQRLNPFRSQVYAAAREALDALESRVEEKDREGFRTALAAARRMLPDEG